MRNVVLVIGMVLITIVILALLKVRINGVYHDETLSLASNAKFEQEAEARVLYYI